MQCTTQLSQVRCCPQARAAPVRPPLLNRRSLLHPKGPKHCCTTIAAQKQQFGSFEELLQGSEVPVLVDFYATWCGPCQMMSGILTNVASQMKPKVKVVKIDTDKYPNLASKYNIGALPTLVLFKDGQPVDRVEGVVKEGPLIERISKVLGHKCDNHEHKHKKEPHQCCGKCH